MRITGGKAKGIPLLVKGGGIRPATDRLREAVFSFLGERIIEGRFLDLFAGIGSYGLEALSRGAAGGCFVEKNGRCAESLQRNLAGVLKSLNRTESGCRIRVKDVFKWRPLEPHQFDFIFIDPPYKLIAAKGEAIFKLASRNLAETLEGRVIFEMPGDLDLRDPAWTMERRLGKGRGSGDPTAAVYKRRG